jgi:protein-S-isoprenylcysteine O-methyltransferase Ste14
LKVSNRRIFNRADQQESGMRYPGILLLVYFIVYFGLAFVWRSVVVYRLTGVQPIRLPQSDDVHGYVGRVFKRLLALCLAYLCAQTFFKEIDAALPSVVWMDKAGWRALGWIVLTVSGAVLVWAQAQMGLSWRIGLDAETPGPLVVRGLFARSRNPIFLSMRLNLVGLMCLLPNLFTLLLWVCGELLIQIQVRLEEDHLPKVYGQAYEAYRAQVPRWW